MYKNQLYYVLEERRLVVVSFNTLTSMALLLSMTEVLNYFRN